MNNTKEKILEAALDLFAQKGFAGTSINDIAQMAQTQKSLIYYYFKDKKEVWHAAKAYMTEQAIKEDLPSSFKNVEDFLRKILEQRLAFYEADPRLARLVKWQMLEDSFEDLLSKGRGSPLLWVDTLKMFQDQGKITKEYSPELLSVFIHSAFSGAILDALHFFATHPQDKKKYMDMVIQSFIKGFCL